jgi:DNA-3-methyladenine glycosylase
MIDDWTPLDRDFFDRPVLEVAPDLLGTVLWHDAGPDGLVAVRLTEVEAYGGADDPGSHGDRGRRPTVTSLAGRPG